MAIIKFENRIKKFFIKTHSKGLKDGGGQKALVDIRELFAYKFLESLYLMPNVHLFSSHIDPSDFYIATEDLGTKFKTFEALAKCKEFLNVFKDNHLEEELNFGILITKLLNLTDVTSNGANYGFLSNKLKIVDFQVDENVSLDNLSNSFECYKSKSLSTKTNEQKPFFEYSSLHKIKVAKHAASVLSNDNYFLNKLNETRRFIYNEYLDKHGKFLFRDKLDQAIKEFNQYLKIIENNYSTFLYCIETE